MKTAGAGVAARQGGGFRQGFGNFDEEHLEQEASASAVAQKQLTQQTAQSGPAPAGGSAQQPSDSHQAAETPTAPPREVSTFGDELIKRPVHDVIEAIKGIFSLHEVLGIRPGDTPEEQEKKKTLNHRYEQLTEEQQEVAKNLFQDKMQKEKLAEEEKEKKKQLEAQKKAENAIAPPSSPQKGPIGFGGPGGVPLSRKKMSEELIERDRQSIGRLQTAG